MANISPNPYSEFIREPNLLMPGRAPTGRVKIDYANPLTESIQGYFLFGQAGLALRCQDLVSGQLGTFQAGHFITMQRTAEGPAIYQALANKHGGYICPTTHFSGSENRLVVARVHSVDLGHYGSIYAAGVAATGEKWYWRSASSHLGWWNNAWWGSLWWADPWWSAGGSALQFARIEIEGSGYTSSLAYPEDTWVTAGCALDGSTLGDHVLFLDREEESCSGAGSVNTGTTYLPEISGLLADAHITADPWPGYIKWVAVFAGDYSMDYWRDIYYELEEDPYQILMPE